MRKLHRDMSIVNLVTVVNSDLLISFVVHIVKKSQSVET